MDIKVLIIPCDDDQDVRVEVLSDYTYKSGQKIVGGLIQPIDLEPSVDATIWSNEEGLLIQLPVNRRATSFLYDHAPEHIGYTILVGDCYVSGLPDDDGDTTSVPDDVITSFIE